MQNNNNSNLTNPVPLRNYPISISSSKSSRSGSMNNLAQLNEIPTNNSQQNLIYQEISDEDCNQFLNTLNLETNNKGKEINTVNINTSPTTNNFTTTLINNNNNNINT